MARTHKWTYEQARLWRANDGQLFPESDPKQLDLFQNNLNEQLCKIEEQKKERLAKSNLLRKGYTK